MNRELWKPKTFEKGGKYPCPKCFNGFLVGTDKIVFELTEGGKEMRQHRYPYGVENVFSGILRCSDSNCNELISVNGLLLTDILVEYIDDNGVHFEKELREYKPKFFYPNLRMFKLSKDIPEDISRLIDESFSLYFTDNNSCANKIRTAIERMLDDLKAPKKRLNKKGLYTPIKILHQRIEHFSKRKPRICKLLMALKIIGNEGSHTMNLNDNDILDAFEILELLIEIIYTKNNTRIELLAERIISSK